MTAPTLAIADHLELEARGSGRYARDIDERWAFDGRVFGGYSAGLAVVAAQHASGHALAAAAHVLFLEAGRPGPAELEVTALRRGRSSWAGRSTLHQNGDIVLVCDSWFSTPRAGGAEPSPAQLAQVPPPDECPDLGWLRGPYPFLDCFEERAIDYPLSAADFTGPGRAAVEVWARPASPVGAGTVADQVVDLMLADAHLGDPAIRIEGMDAVTMLSLDLSMWWESRSAPTPWLRVRADAIAGGPLVTATAAIHTTGGVPRATAGQKCRMVRLR